MSSNQSGADKDNRLLLGEQKTIVFQIQDGGGFFSAKQEPN